ncbi:MAG: cytochrome P450 [Myxococcota bacterium]
MSLTTIAKSLKKNLHHKRPPGPGGLPFLGPIREVRRDALGFMVKMARDHGDVAYTRFAGMPTYLISHPDGIEHCLVTKKANYPKSDIAYRFRPLLGEGLLTSRGPLWTRQRKMMSPSFQHRRVQAYGEAMVAVTQRHLDRWQSGTIRAVNEDMMHLTLDIAVATLFGTSASDEADRVSRALTDASDYFARTLSDPLPLPLSIPTPLNRAFNQARLTLDEVVHRIIQQRRESQTRGADLLSVMLDLVDEEGQGMNDVQLRDEVLTLLLAGHETTALTLTYALRLLALHPTIDRQIGEALYAKLGGRAPTLEDLPALQGVEQVVKEAMRLFPPAAVITRKALEDDQVMGFAIPAGAMVVLPQWVTHRDPRFFPDPEAFTPARWTEEMEAALPRFAYFPFGGGPRVCIGSSFAMLEAQLVLAGLLQRFRLSPADEKPLELVASITVRPRNPVRLWAEARTR